MEIKNLTKHPIRIYNDKLENVANIPVWRRLHIMSSTEVVGKIGDIPIIDTEYICKGYIDDVAPIEEGVVYITSQVVCVNYPHREDFYVPIGLIKKGSDIVGCRGISKNPYLFMKNDRGGEIVQIT